jgi:hypothetical protein
MSTVQKHAPAWEENKKVIEKREKEKSENNNPKL